jgi:hypothetical protein
MENDAGSTNLFLNTTNWLGEATVYRNKLLIGDKVEFVNVSFEKTLVGKGNVLNVINLNFIPGNKYRIRPIKNNWTSAYNGLDTILKFQVILNGSVSQEIISVNRLENIQNEYIFTAIENVDFYQLFIRADIGKYAQFEIDNISDLSGANYYGYVECTSAADAEYKDITIPNFPYNGNPNARFVVRFTNANTANNAKLRINNTNVYDMFYNGYRTSADNTWDSAIRTDVIIYSNNYCILSKIFYIQDKIDESTVAAPTSRAVKDLILNTTKSKIEYNYNGWPVIDGYIDSKGYMNGLIKVALDTAVYEGKTLRDIFEVYNFLGISPGFENGSFNPMTVNVGTPVIESSVVDSGDYALQIGGQELCQIKSSIAHGISTKYYYTIHCRFCQAKRIKKRSCSPQERHLYQSSYFLTLKISLSIPESSLGLLTTTIFISKNLPIISPAVCRCTLYYSESLRKVHSLDLMQSRQPLSKLIPADF